MDYIGIIQLLVPVATFAMGYYLTDIGYKRERKLSITREKFEKLYHPFYMMINELGTAREEGFEFDTETEEGRNGLKQLLDHLIANVYLASSEGQSLFWETRRLFISCTTKGDTNDKEKEQLLEKSLGELFGYLIMEYIKSANALGYEFDAAKAFVASPDVVEK